MKNILFFDTETTGLPADFSAPYTDTKNWPRLVQLAWQLYRGEDLAAEGNAIVFPDGYEIPEAAAQIHGITTAKAWMEGKGVIQVLRGFEKVVYQSELLVAHNYWFDFPIVAAEIVRSGGYAEGFAQKPWYCTKDESADLCKLPKLKDYYKNTSQYKTPSLDELHQFLFGEPIAGRETYHDAMIDVRATARCYFEMQRRMQGPTDHTKATIL